MSDSDKQWREWGAHNPYFGVISDEAFRRGSIDKQRELFFSGGEEFIAGILAQARDVGMAPSHTNAALDFGCGVGRLVIPLAKRFGHVTGVDISPDMLAEARRNCEALELSNVVFLPGAGILDGVVGPFDFVNSYIVLQHIPPARGYLFIDSLLSKVAPGGAAMLHVSVRRYQGLARKLIYWTKHNVPFARFAFNILQRRDLHEPLMQMNEYDIPHILRIFAAHGMPDVVLSMEIHGFAMTARFLARRTG